MGRLFWCILLFAATCAVAQDDGKSNTPSQQSEPNAPSQGAADTKPQTGSSQSGAGSPTSPNGNSNSSQPTAGGLSNDLTFPEDDPTPATPAPSSPKTPNLTAPRSDRVQVEDLGRATGESSSKDAAVDLSAPPDDAKAHPQSSAAVADAAAGMGSGGITEFHSWDPHKAAKNVEVGDFYFKQKNYRAAENRYREALRYKDNDAVATIRLAVCLEKLGILDDARAEYESYLKILPHGPQAKDAAKAIARLQSDAAK